MATVTLTITIQEGTAAFIESGFAYTMYNGTATVRMRREQAYADWRRAFESAIWSNDDEVGE